MITIFRYFDNVLICLKMALVFLSLLQRKHKMQILRKLKRTNSILILIIYRPASEQRFYLVFISDIINIRSHYKESKARNLIEYIFTMSLLNSVYLV